MDRTTLRWKGDGTLVVQTHCPFHDDHNPSLSVLLWKHNDTLRSFVRCWAGCHVGVEEKEQVLGWLLSLPKVQTEVEKLQPQEPFHTPLFAEMEDTVVELEKQPDNEPDTDKGATNTPVDKKTKVQVLRDFIKSRGLHPDVAKAAGLATITHQENSLLLEGEVGVLVPMVGVYQKDSYQIRIVNPLLGRPKYLTKPQTVCGLFQIMVNVGKDLVFCESPVKALVLASKMFELGLEKQYSVVYSTGVTNCTSKNTLSELIQLVQETNTPKVIVWFDADRAGEQGANKVESVLQQHNIKCVKVDTNFIKETIASTNVQTGLGTDDYFNALLQTQPLTKSNLIPQKRGIVPKRLRDIAVRPQQFLLHPFVPLQGITIVEGDPGSGKSFFTLGLACACATGKVLVLGDTHLKLGVSGPVFIFACEDAEGVVLERVSQICSGEVPDNLFVVTDVFDLNNALSDIESLIVDNQPKLIVFDPIMSYMGANTDIYRDNAVRSVLEPLNKLSVQHNTAVVLVRHLKKEKEGSTSIYHGVGSIAFSALARSVVSVHKEDFGVSRIELVKSSYCSNVQNREIEYGIGDMRVE